MQGNDFEKSAGCIIFREDPDPERGTCVLILRTYSKFDLPKGHIEKKDKNQLRLLLDGRLLNENTVKYPTSLVTQPEVFAHLHNRKWVSNADVSHSFFQVPISSKSQPYTAFFSQAHGKRYCFQRCPQGLKNSPLYLKLLMDKLLVQLR